MYIYIYDLVFKIKYIRLNRYTLVFPFLKVVTLECNTLFFDIPIP